MAFCTKCGRQLQDGEVCNCQQQPTMAPQQTAQAQQVAAVKAAGSNAFAEIMDLIKGIFTQPAECVASYVSKASVVMIAILIGAQAIMNALVRLFAMLVANSKVKSSVKSFDDALNLLQDYYTSGSAKLKYSTGDMFLNMFKEILEVAVAAAIFALVVWLLVKAFDKVNATFMQSLAVYSLTCVLGVPAKFLNWVVGLTTVGFLDQLAGCILTFSTVVGYVLIVFGVRAMSKKENNLPLIIGIAFVAVKFVAWIVGLMF